MQNRETELYRYYDEKGLLLYVGISLSSVARQAQHKLASSWYQKAVLCKISRYENREKALIAERDAIMKEKPAYNVIHNKANDKEDELFFERNCYRDRVRLLGKIVSYKPIYNPREISEILYGSQSSSGKVKALIESQKLQGILTKEREQKGAQGQIVIIRDYLVTGWQLIDFIEALEQGEVSL